MASGRSLYAALIFSAFHIDPLAAPHRRDPIVAVQQQSHSPLRCLDLSFSAELGHSTQREPS